MSRGTSTVSIITSEILRPNHISHCGAAGVSGGISAPSADREWSSITHVRATTSVPPSKRLKSHGHPALPALRADYLGRNADENWHQQSSLNLARSAPQAAQKGPDARRSPAVRVERRRPLAVARRELS